MKLCFGLWEKLVYTNLLKIKITNDFINICGYVRRGGYAEKQTPSWLSRNNAKMTGEEGNCATHNTEKGSWVL